MPTRGIFSKMECCVFSVHHQSLRLSQPNNFTDRQYARTHRAASDMLLVTCKLRWCCRFWALHGVSGVPFGALLAILQQRLLVARLFAARLWLSEVG